MSQQLRFIRERKAQCFCRCGQPLDTHWPYVFHRARDARRSDVDQQNLQSERPE